MGTLWRDVIVADPLGRRALCLISLTSEFEALIKGSRVALRGQAGSQSVLGDAPFAVKTGRVGGRAGGGLPAAVVSLGVWGLGEFEETYYV